MNLLYLAALVVAIAGLVVLDARLRLFLFAAPLRALVVLAAGVAGFLLWDTAGIGLGIFFEGNRSLLVGVDLAREVPLEEVFFLVLLCLTGMEAFLLALRLQHRRAARRSGSC
jgi:lycopene cyclase domain-containing protein